MTFVGCRTISPKIEKQGTLLLFLGVWEGGIVHVCRRMVMPDDSHDVGGSPSRGTFLLVDEEGGCLTELNLAISKRCFVIPIESFKFQWG